VGVKNNSTLKKRRFSKLALNKYQKSKQKLIDLITPVRIIRLGILLFLIAFLSLTLGREILTVGQGSISSFIIVHFAGYLFFFLLPVEALVPYYYSQGFLPELLFVLAIVTAVCAQTIDYLIGRLAPSTITRHLIGERRYLRIQSFVEKHGGWLIFVFNLFPLSSSVVAVISGVLDFSFWRWLVYSSVGLLVKYAVILLVLNWWI
jgi:membrane protein DedA with SNARE-associated domain